MEKEIRGINLQIDNFKTEMVNFINESNLPIAVVYYVLKDVLLEVERVYNQAASAEYQDFCEQAIKEKQEKNKSEEKIESEEEESSSDSE